MSRITGGAPVGTSGNGAGPAPRGRALVVALRFPPHGGGGVQRTTYFVRYLQDLGWDAHVLTGPGSSHRLRDSSLQSVLPDDLSVTRTGYWETRSFYRALGKVRLATPARWLTPALPMMQPGWIPHALKAGREILEEGGVDLIYSTAYPVSAHVVAFLLKREFGLPWVADFRDTWSQREILHWPTPLHQRLAEWMEGKIVESADRIVTTSPAATASFRQAHPAVPADRYRLVTNGYEPSEVTRSRPVPEPLDADRRWRLRITHVGLVSESRRPDGLMDALRQVLDDGSVPENRIRVTFVGQTGDLGGRDLEERGVVRRIPYVDHETAIGWMQHSDVLLLLNGESVNIPGKLFEYLGVGRPVLALMPRGPAAAILRENEAGTTIPPDDAPRIAGALRDLHRRWRSGALEAAPRTPPARFTREATARSLARTFDEVRDDVATGRRDGDMAAGAAGPGHRGGHGTGEREGARVSG